MAFSTSSHAYFVLVAVAMAGIMAATTTTVAAQNSPQDFVSLHNQARARARVGPVSWDGRLARKIEEYVLIGVEKPLCWLARHAYDRASKVAGDCSSIGNSLNDDNVCGPYGENVFWGPPGGGRWPRTWSAADAVASWVGEKPWYQRGANVCSAPWGKTCGHYTQVVWRGSTRIGCASVNCAGGRRGRGVVVVCSYDPRGNVYGQTPY